MFKESSIAWLICLSLTFFVFTAENQIAHADTNSGSRKPIAQNGNDTHGFLFELKSNKKQFYLFGTLHFGNSDLYPVSPKLDSAYKNSDVLAVETDLTDAYKLKASWQKMMYKPPKKLQDHVKPKTWASLSKILGSRIDQTQGLRASTLSSMIKAEVSAKMGFDLSKNYDAYFLTRAKLEKKNVLELEGIEFQSKILSSISDDESDAIVASLVRMMEDNTVQKEIDTVFRTWKQGDMISLNNLLVIGNQRAPGLINLNRRLYAQRNDSIAEKIKGALDEDKRVFAMVSSVRLVGENNLLDRFKKLGFEVTQIR